MKKIILNIFLALVLVCGLTACTKDSGNEGNNEPQKDTSVTMSFAETQVSMTVGETKQIKPSVKLGKDVVGFSITYSITGEAATEDQNANVTAIAPGTVILIATGSEGTAATDIFIFPASSSNMVSSYQTRIYLKTVDEANGIYKVVEVEAVGASTSWPTDANYVIVIWSGYKGTANSNLTITKIGAGTNVILSAGITTASHETPINISFKGEGSVTGTITLEVNKITSLFIPKKPGYVFSGWYDSEGNKYTKASDFVSDISVKAEWVVDNRIIGSFEDVSYVTVGDQITLSAEYVSGGSEGITWVSETPEIAMVEGGVVTGHSKGIAKIVAKSNESELLDFVFYITVLDESATGIEKLLVESNNVEIFKKENLLVGILNQSPAPYYADVNASVSKLLFTDYLEHENYYLEDPANKSTLTGAGKGGVDFITVHYAADMTYSATASLTGGKNLASYNKTCNTNGTSASWNYSVGNDGIWYCQNVAYGSWHAGSAKTMTWTNSGVTTSQVGTDIYSTDVTLGSDGYFYLKVLKHLFKIQQEKQH